VATVIGAVLGIKAWLLLPILLTWLIVVMLSGYVGLGSIVASAALPAYVAWSGLEPFEALLIFGIAVVALVIYTHRANIGRMLAGTEPRARKLWVLGGRHG
jgi:glycerol-3-phosphate acyltransferase PlsY